MPDNRITTANLFLKAKKFVVAKKAERSLDYLIKEAIIDADRELRTVDPFSPLAWDIQPYNLLRTNIHAEITAITAAAPGVITAASVDSNITGHGFNKLNVFPIVYDGTDYTNEVDAGAADSELLTGGLWALTRATISTTTAIVDPEGNLDASKLILDASAANSHYVEYNDVDIVSGQTQCFSVYAKAAEHNWVRLSCSKDGASWDTFWQFFDLTNGVVGTSGTSESATYTGSSIEDVGNGWYRCTIWGTVPHTEILPRVAIAEGDTDVTIDGDSSSGVYLWQASYTQNSTVTNTYESHKDIILIAGVDGAEGSNNIEILNGQLFLLEYINSTTFSLKTLDGLNDVDTSVYTAYSDGGYIYHAGYVLNTVPMLTGQTAWGFKRICNPVMFDKYPAQPISEEVVRQNSMWLDSSYAQRPKRYRYWRNMASPTSETHYLFWYPVANQAYNLSLSYEKEIPDISTWTGSVYPFHPGEVHAYLWHGALANLAGMSQRVKRQSQDRIVTKVEVMFAQKWIGEWEKDKRKVLNFSRKMLGASGGQSDFYA